MSASTVSQDICSICKEDIEDSNEKWVAVQLNGGKGINAASVKRKDNLVVAVGAKVHIICRQRYINEKDIKSHVAKKSGDSAQPKRTKRQSSGGLQKHFTSYM